MNVATTPSPFVGDLGAGHSLGRYELLMPIASGGMAMVWAARLKGSRGFQKIVAVKTMLPKLSEDAQFEQMFLDEASLASQVRHPHVVEIMDLGEQDGVLFLVMEWIDGVPLNQILKAARRAGGVPLPVAVRICMQGLAGLHAAHELKDRDGNLVGLVHRDVSPQNLLVAFDGVTKVVDFGVAKATALGGGATQAGQIKGKVAYMAPEQIKETVIDRRIDVFAMGVVLYMLTTGKHPFRKESDAATLYSICAPEPVVSPRKLIPAYPLALDRAVSQALAKDPAKRFPTANDFLRALDQSLPASMRASTDDEVAKFVNSLMGDRREQQRAALQAALARADEHAAEQSQESAVKLRDLLDSQPPPSTATAPSGVSEVSTVTRASDAEMISGSMPDGTGQNLALTAVDLEMLQVRRSRTPLIVVATVLFVALAVGAVALARSTLHSAPAAAPAPAVTTAKPVPTVAETATPTATETASAAPSESAPAPSAEASSEPAEAPTHHRTWRAPSAPATAKTSSSKQQPPTNSWKHDPGF